MERNNAYFEKMTGNGKKAKTSGKKIKIAKVWGFKYRIILGFLLILAKINFDVKSSYQLARAQAFGSFLVLPPLPEIPRRYI